VRDDGAIDAIPVTDGLRDGGVPGRERRHQGCHDQMARSFGGRLENAYPQVHHERMKMKNNLKKKSLACGKEKITPRLA
jgi:hypothetical protein